MKTPSVSSSWWQKENCDARRVCQCCSRKKGHSIGCDRRLPRSGQPHSPAPWAQAAVGACPPSLADPSMFVRAVGLLIVTSSHCSSFEPGIVATASILATLIFSFPFFSLFLFDHCGATLSRSTVAPNLRSCLARLSQTLSWIRVLHGLF